MAYVKRHPEGWKNFPDTTTPVMGEDLDYFEDTFDAHDKSLVLKAASQTELWNSSGEPTGTFLDTNALLSTLYLMVSTAPRTSLYNTTGVGPTELPTRIIIASEMPGSPSANHVYFIRAEDGTCTVHIPVLENEPAARGASTPTADDLLAYLISQAAPAADQT